MLGSSVQAEPAVEASSVEEFSVHEAQTSRQPSGAKGAVELPCARDELDGPDVPASPQQQEQEVKDEDVTCCAKFCYTFLAFFAYWFGSARFDCDGDGDFDAADVQAMINGGSKKMMLNFVRPPKDRKAKIKRRERAQVRRRQKEAEMKKAQRLHEDNVRAHQEAGGVAGAVGVVAEKAMHGIVVQAWQEVEDALDGVVEDEAQEEEIIDNLKQALPYFCIVEVLLCFLLWVVTAFRSRSYTLLTYMSGVTGDNIPSTYVKDDGTTLFKGECEAVCSAAGEACLGIAWLPGPSPQCHLLGRLPTSETSGGNCPRSTWDWRVYAKDTWSLSGSMGQSGGADRIWPGRTLLKAYHNCEDGYDTSFLWRWWSYQFSHGSISHVVSNCLMVLMLGIPLEGWQGTGMIVVMWTLGCLGGACCWALFDPYRDSFGASGGCYSLIGMHIADLVMNWADKKWRIHTMAFLLVLCGMDFAAFYATYDPDGGATAHCVHVGGLVAGILIGMTGGRNEHWKWWEIMFNAVAWVLGVGLLGGSFVFWYGANDHPAIANLWDYSQRPWCWIGEVCIGDDGAHCPLLDTPPTYTTGATTVDETRRQCVFCTTRECVEGWYSSYTAADGTEHYKYCPTESAQSICGDEFTDSWDLFYPPTKSKYQD